MSAKKSILLIVLLVNFCLSSRGGYKPVTLTTSSYNKDVIANGVGAPNSSTTGGFDDPGAGGYVFISDDYKYSNTCSVVPADQGLPVNGQLTGIGQYQFASYNGNNVLQLTNSSATGTMTLATPVAAADFYILAASGSGNGMVDVTVTFTDASTEQITGISIPDWYGGSANLVFYGSRIQRNRSTCGGFNAASNGPNLYEINVQLSLVNQTKSIASVSFTGTAMTPNLTINVLALSLSTPCSAPAPVTISSLSSVCAGKAFQLLSTVYTGNTIQWEESLQSTGPWSPIANATSNICVIPAGITTPTNYRAVVTCNMATSVSNVITVGINPYYDCYCSPLNGTELHTGALDRIVNVTIQSTTMNSSNGVGANGIGYTKTNALVTTNTANLMQGAQYTIQVTKTATGGNDPVDGWIDYDQNGNFDANEYISFSTGNPSLATISVPSTVPTGLTGMRIRYRTSGASFGASGACTLAGLETEDYFVTIVAAVNCNGAPVTATASASTTALCSNISFSLHATNVAVGSGISYQWEEKPQGSSWIPITGATNVSYTVTNGITMPTDYRFASTCSFGGTSYSNIVAVSINNPAQCVCTPVYSSGCTMSGLSVHIDGVKLTGTNSTSINNSNSGCSPNGYGTYLSQSVDLLQSVTYTAAITFNNTASSLLGAIPAIAAWIDLDDDGVFNGTTEMLVATTLPATSGNVNLNLAIPSSAPAGAHRMRIRFAYDSNTPLSLSPCADLIIGETEDYMVNIVIGANCSGLPASATISSPTTILCANDSLVLTANGVTYGSGISYQWEELPFGSSLWSAISGATNTTYKIHGNALSGATGYRFVTTCAFGGTSTSNTLTISPALATQCHCIPIYSAGGCSYFSYEARIDGVQIAGANSTAINNMNSGCSANGYGKYLNQSVDLPAGLVLAANLALVCNAPGSTPGIAAWIDFNDDGVIDTVTETVGSALLPATNTLTSLTLSIPANAPLGPHLFRIRYVVAAASMTPINPCADELLGEAEDYMVNIIVPSNCSGLPVAATIVAAQSSICMYDSTVLSASGVAVGLGITYQWESSPAGANAWSPINGATNTIYNVSGSSLFAATDYKMVITCASGGSSSSNVVTIVPDLPAKCPCIPIYQFGCSDPVMGDQAMIDTLQIAGVNNTGISNEGSGCSAYAYGVYLNQSVDLLPGSTYPAHLFTINSFLGMNPGVAAWIDFDDNGAFDTLTEIICSANLPVGSSTVSFIIPANASQGPHRMRIRYVFHEPNPATLSPCADGQMGEAEDYMVNIISPLSIKLLHLTAENDGALNKISWSTASEDKGDFFILEHSTDGKRYDGITWLKANGRGSSYEYLDKPALAPINYYRLKMLSADGSYSYSKIVSVNTNMRPGFTGSLHPNPAHTLLFLELKCEEDQEVRYDVVDMMGRVVQFDKLATKKGIDQQELDVSRLSPGKYFIRVVGSDQVLILRFIKN